MTEPRKIFRWSFSQWESYQSCPARWKFASVMKLPRLPPGPAAARGLGIHKGVEDYIMGAAPTPPPEVKPKYIPILNEFKHHENGDRYVEKRLAFDSDWHVCAPRAPEAACVGYLDASRFANDLTLYIGEWKSGKPKDTHVDQRKLYALFGLLHWKAPIVKITTYYLEDTAKPEMLIVKDTAIDKLKALWNTRRDLMERDEICAPRPGLHCRWCDYAKARGGPCQF